MLLLVLPAALVVVVALAVVVRERADQRAEAEDAPAPAVDLAFLATPASRDEVPRHLRPGAATLGARLVSALEAEAEVAARLHGDTLDLTERPAPGRQAPATVVRSRRRRAPLVAPGR